MIYFDHFVRLLLNISLSHILNHCTNFNQTTCFYEVPLSKLIKDQRFKLFIDFFDCSSFRKGTFYILLLISVSVSRIIWYKCFLVDPLQKMLKPYWLVEKHNCHGTSICGPHSNLIPYYKLFSSPENEVLKVSYCDHLLSVILFFVNNCRINIHLHQLLDKLKTGSCEDKN